MKVYIILDQDYDCVTDIHAYSNKQEILDKEYNKRKAYVENLETTTIKKEYFLKSLEESYKNEELWRFRIWEVEVQ